MYIKIKNKKQEHKVLEKLGNNGFRWATGVYPLDFKPSLLDSFQGFQGFPILISVEIVEGVLCWDNNPEVGNTKYLKAKDFLSPEHIKTDNSKVNENLLKENEELKDMLCDIAKELESSVTGSIYTKYLLKKFFTKKL